jgi:hypothetical protein
MNNFTLTRNDTIAFLVLGYSAPLTLRQTLRHFSSTKCNFFLHLDSKIDSDHYLALSESQDRVTMVDERFSIYWGGYSMIKATLALIKTALQKSDASTFVLISDDSFPLHDENTIINKLIECPNRVFMHPVAEKISYPRYDNFYFPDANFSSTRHLPAEERVVTVNNVESLERLKKLILRGKYFPIKLHTGSQWWSLSRKVLDYCIGRLESDLWLEESFEFSMIPDEMVFQTLAAEILKNTANGYCYAEGMMFADFSKLHKPDKYFSISDFPSKINSDKLFIRKFIST